MQTLKRVFGCWLHDLASAEPGETMPCCSISQKLLTNHPALSKEGADRVFYIMRWCCKCHARSAV
jgi:hypothetical protein